MENKYLVGFLILTILISGIVYIQLNNKVKIRVDNDKTTFYVPHEEYPWLWVVSGREYNKLFDGTSLMYRDVSSIKIDTKIEGNKTWIIRNTTYQRGPKIVDTYYFDGNINSVEMFPISHTVEIYNGSGYFYRYEVRDLEYSGETKKLDVNSMNFGKNMKVEWQEKNKRWARVYKSGILKVQYDIPTDYEKYEVRLFDPQLSDGLVAYYKLDQTSGVILDETGNYDGTDNGATRGVDGIINKSIKPTSSTNEPSIPSIPGMQNFTINLWGYLESYSSYSTGSQIVTTASPYFGLAGNGGNQEEHKIEIKYNDNIGAIEVEGYMPTRTSFSISSSFKPSLASWHMITVKREGSTLKLYINGSYIGSTSVSSTELPFTYYYRRIGGFSINNNVGHSDRAINGRIDEVGLWNRGLSDSEIAYLWDSGQAERPFTDSDTKPPIVLLYSPVNNSYRPNSTINFIANVSDFVSDIQNCSLYTNEGGWGPKGTNTSCNNGNCTIGGSFSSEGVFRWNFYCYDSAGNLGFNDSNYTLIVDLNNPKVEFRPSASDNNTWINSGQIIADVIINETNPANSTYRLFNATGVYNITTYNVSGYSIQDKHNWTSLPDGNYTFNVIIVDKSGRTNSTETREVYLDSVPPLINYTANSDTTNESGDFNDKNWIFVNVSVTELNEANITFSLYSYGIIYNQTTYTDKTRTINWTNLPKNMYFWNVTIVDKAGNSNTTNVRKYGEKFIKFSINNRTENLSVELGSTLSLNANYSDGLFYLDIDHPDYGINYTTGNYFIYLPDMLITWFRKTIFSDGSSSKSFTGSYLNGSTYENVSGFEITSHQYDEVVNLSVNVSSNDALDLIFYGCNSTNIDRIYDGQFIGNYIYLNSTYEGLDKDNLSFSTPGTSSLYFYIDDNVDIKNISFNISAEEYGFSYEKGTINGIFDDFDMIDTTLTNATLGGGLITPGGDSPKNFYYDNFDDGSINHVLWDLLVNGNYVADTHIVECGQVTHAGYTYTIDNKETGGYLELKTENFQPDYDQYGCNCDCPVCYDYCYESGLDSVFNYVKVNESNNQLNIWTANNILFELDYYSSGYEKSTNTKCRYENNISLANSKVWESHFDFCTNEYSGSFHDCIEYAETIEPLKFNLTRQINGSWRVRITGVEKTHGVYHPEVDCGSFQVIYNYTSGFWKREYTGACAGSNGTLENDFYINPSWFSIPQLIFGQYSKGYYDKETEKGCNDIDSWTRIYYVNQTLLNRKNTTVISKSIFDSSSNIASATPYFDAIGPNGTNIVGYLSADNGENWEQVSNNVLHYFSNPGKNIKFRLDFNVGEGGYVNITQIFDYLNISTEKGNLSNVTFDFGDDGTIDHTISGNFTISNGSIQVNLGSMDISNIFTNLADSYNHLYKVPLEVGTNTPGKLIFESFNITYDPNPIILNTTYIQDYLNNYGNNETNFTINFGYDGGTINLSDVRYDYAGGNNTIKVTVHNEDYSVNVTRYLFYYYSRWDYVFGLPMINYLEFIPKSPIEKNVTPYGQANNIPILNITNYGYGGLPANLSIYLNDTETNQCVNLTISLDNNKSHGYQIGEYWTDLNKSLDYLETQSIWMWADYECNYANWKLFNPYLYFRECANNSICSEDIT